MRADIAAGREPARDELFLTGTEQRRASAGAQLQAQRRDGITSPRDGSVYALDPDIPPAAQRIVFEGEEGTWRLDGRSLGRGTSHAWAPLPGRHVLELLGRDGRAWHSLQT